jgi:hypothetical protein
MLVGIMVFVAGTLANGTLYVGCLYALDACAGAGVSGSALGVIIARMP